MKYNLRTKKAPPHRANGRGHDTEDWSFDVRET